MPTASPTPSYKVPVMTDNRASFDPNVWFDAYRETFAPVYRWQQDGFKTIERVARFSYSVAGDYLESGIQHAQAALAARNPSDFLTKGAEIGSRLGERICSRVQELMNITTEAQGQLSQFASEAVSRATPTTPKKVQANA
jgi:Phasin protein